jgi:hypothetical protein
MRLIECIHTQSKCYNAADNKVTPVGIVVHSTGANNTSVKRYVQPSTNDPKYTELRSLIGVNKYSNHWNRSISKGVHYFIGKIADGSIATVKTLPETMAAWGVGKGKNGSYNYNPTAHIQFEVCEDNLKNADYFNAVYKEATELCADICKRYGWKPSVIVSHKESYKKGYGSNHSDIDHWLAKYGLTMNDFRKEVERLLEPPKPVVKPVEVVPTIKKGDKVKLVTGAKWYNGKKIPSWVFKKTLYVRAIETKGGKTVYLLSTYEKLPSYTGRAYPEAVKKV